MLLQGLLKLVALVALAAGVGVVLGLAISELTNDDAADGVVGASTAQQSAGSATTTVAPTPAGQDPLEQIRVRVISAVLHPAATPSGMRRRRARLSVHVEVTNPTGRRVTPGRPSLLAARQRTTTNPRADGPGTSLGSIEPGTTADVRLLFETAGAVTEQLTTQKRARVLIGGRSWPVTVKVGSPARSTAQSGAIRR